MCWLQSYNFSGSTYNKTCYAWTRGPDKHERVLMSAQRFSYRIAKIMVTFTFTRPELEPIRCFPAEHYGLRVGDTVQSAADCPSSLWSQRKPPTWVSAVAAWRFVRLSSRADVGLILYFWCWLKGGSTYGNVQANTECRPDETDWLTETCSYRKSNMDTFHWSPDVLCLLMFFW